MFLHRAAPTRIEQQLSISHAEHQKQLEATLWDAANSLRSSMDASEYKHVVLGLIFLKYVSDVFSDRQAQLEKLVNDENSEYYMPSEAARQSLLEERDEYTSEGVFWIPEGHRWEDLRKAAKQNDIGKLIDAAMEAIERENPKLKGVLPKNYSRKELQPAALGGLIDTFSREDLASEEAKSFDVLGRIYEYFLGKFAAGEGKGGGEFYTPAAVVSLMVEMLQPFNGRVYDPTCGSGGMFVQADKFVKAHGGQRNDISVIGQEMNPTTWRLAQMNLALRGIEANLGKQWGDTLLDDQHPDLRADFIMANPPFNISDWGASKVQDDVRWKYGIPTNGNANYAWIQHMLHHLSPTGTMAMVLSNGSLSADSSGQGDIRRRLIEDDLVECIVSLPSQLFYTTQIPACIWFLTKDKTDRKVKSERPQRNRKGEVLFIDAGKLGYMATRTNRELSGDDVALIARTYNAWRGDPDLQPYLDVDGFNATVSLGQIADNGHILTPGRYVGTEAVTDDGEPLDEKIARLAEEIQAGFMKRAELQAQVVAALSNLKVA